MLDLFPTCARDGCEGLGLIRVDVSDENGEAWADICILCLPQVLTLMRDVTKIQEEDRLLSLSQERLPAPKEED